MNRIEAQELLPWHVAGTLSAEESRAVQAFIDSGEISQQEVDALSMFADTVQQQEQTEPAFRMDLLEETMAQLDEVEQVAVEPSVVVAEPQRQPQRQTQGLAGWLQGFSWNGLPGMAKFAIAGQFALVVGLGAMLMQAPPSTDDAAYVTVSGAPAVSGGDFSLAVAETLSVAELAELLAVHNVEIVGGPNSMGMFRIALTDPSADLEVVRSALASDTRVIFIQPLAK
ncbi:MAG: hypothetical protein AAF529_02495 [Pseudomonadota bacterium]